jgi:anhydro-N-acetylmuramic acid kinase
MALLQNGLKPLGVRLRAMDDFGVPSQAKEGVAFALLAWLTWSGLPGNVPSATGAMRPVVLGKITHA